MKIIILGAGGIGSLVGALLSEGNDVLLVGRKEHVDKLNKDGLEISGCVNVNVKVKASEKIEGIEEDSLIVLVTKTFDIEDSLKEIKHLIKETNTILVLQNGLGNEELVKDIVDCNVLRGITTAGVTFLEPGKINCSNIGDISLENSPVSGSIADIFNKAGLKAEISEDIKKRIWIKLIANCVMNPLSAILKIKNGELIKMPDLIKLVINEIVRVAEKEGLKFNNDEVFDLVVKVIKDSAENKSSMLQDILKCKKTEIDFMNGKVVELGKKYKVATPVNEMIVSMVKFLENKKV